MRLGFLLVLCFLILAPKEAFAAANCNSYDSKTLEIGCQKNNLGAAGTGGGLLGSLLKSANPIVNQVLEAAKSCMSGKCNPAELGKNIAGAAVSTAVAGALKDGFGDSVLGSAAKGAITGAATTAVTGGDIAKEALSGAKSGAIAGAVNEFGKSQIPATPSELKAVQEIQGNISKVNSAAQNEATNAFTSMALK